MVKLLTDSKLDLETQKYNGTGGASQGNGEYGFIPAFLDASSGTIYLSRSANGNLSKVHILDGLPKHLIISKKAGHVKSVQESVVAGFVLNETFFTRDEAAQFVTEKLTKFA